MTSFDQFFAEKRKTRTRLKVAGLTAEILEFRARGANFKDIAEYLNLDRGISVTPRALAAHIQRYKARELVTAQTTYAPEHPGKSATTQSIATDSALHAATQPPTDSIPPKPTGEQCRTPIEENLTAELTRTAPVQVRYNRNSQEHLERVAALRSRNRKSKP